MAALLDEEECYLLRVQNIIGRKPIYEEQRVDNMSMEKKIISVSTWNWKQWKEDLSNG